MLLISVPMSFQDPYRNQDVFAGARGHRRRIPQPAREVTAENGVVVEASYDGFVGAIIGLEKTFDGWCVRLEDRHGKSRLFPMHERGFLIDGKPVTLVRPKAQPKKPSQDLSASGSRRVHNVKAKVALPSRIWVEGIHDAAIVEKVWGHDLRVEGVVVEYLEGLDNLPERLAEFGPGPKRRVGVLADHLVEGSKESRMTQQLGPHVMVTGHPFIDVWQAVKPSSVGIEAWPEVPYGEDWKTGICRRLGWGDDPKEGWRRVYAGVHTYRDLESDLIGAVERLVDFVTEPHMQY